MRSRFRQAAAPPKRPDLKSVSIHALPGSVVLSLHFVDGATMTLTFPPEQAGSLGKGLQEARVKAIERKAGVQ